MAGDVCKATPFVNPAPASSPFFQPGFLSSLEIFDVSTWTLVFNGFPGGAEVKASASNVGDLGLIPGSARSPGEEMATHSSILAWRIPWMEELSELKSTGHKESDATERLHFHFHFEKGWY